MHQSRMFVVLLIAGILAGVGGLVFVSRAPTERIEFVDSPILVANKGASPPSSVAVEQAPGTTIVHRVKTVPRDPYAAEKIQEIGTIEIPKIGLVHRMFHGITLRNIDQGPSHWPGTALPGENGNVVVAGHRVTHTHPFKRIHELVPGDRVIFTVNGLRSVYVVTGHEIVSPRALHIVDQTPTPTGTLFACHPPGSAKQRYVVRLALTTE